MGRRATKHTSIQFRPLSPDGNKLDVDVGDRQQVQLFNSIVDIGIKRTKRIVRMADDLTLCQMLAAAYMQGMADAGLIMANRAIIGAMP